MSLRQREEVQTLLHEIAWAKDKGLLLPQMHADSQRLALPDTLLICWAQSATPTAYLGCFASKGVLRQSRLSKLACFGVSTSPVGQTAGAKDKHLMGVSNLTKSHSNGLSLPPKLLAYVGEAGPAFKPA